jgi:hypothetical protein
MISSVLSRAMKERPRCSAICLRCCLLRMTIWALSAEGCVSVPRMGVGEASATTLAMPVRTLDFAFQPGDLQSDPWAVTNLVRRFRPEIVHFDLKLRSRWKRTESYWLVPG